MSGISRASGLSRPHFQNAAPVRCAPCQSRAATTYPSQLSTSLPATALKQTQKRPNHRHSGHHFAQAERKCPESPPPGGHAFPYMLVLLLCGREGSFENWTAALSLGGRCGRGQLVFQVFQQMRLALLHGPAPSELPAFLAVFNVFNGFVAGVEGETAPGFFA